jgi:outer membrane biosynthesis protein TonB
MAHTKPFRSMLALSVVVVSMLALAPAGFAGEDDDPDDEPVPAETIPTTPTEPVPPPLPPPAPTPPPPPVTPPAAIKPPVKVSKPAPARKSAPAKTSAGSKSSSGSSGSSSASAPSTSQSTYAAVGRSDTTRAYGGVQAGFGGMSASDSASLVFPIGLAGGGVVVLMAAGALSRRRILEH